MPTGLEGVANHAGLADDGASAGGSGGSGTGALIVDVVAASNIALSGAQTIDGFAATATDRALVIGQTDPLQNGVYVVAAGAWSRIGSALFDTSVPGSLISVAHGTVYAGSIWAYLGIDVDVGLLFSLAGPSFGPDTNVPVANNAGVLKTALRILTDYTDDTAGSEDSRVTFYVQASGTLTPIAVYYSTSGTLVWLVPDAVLFNSDQDTGIIRAGANVFGLYVNNVQVASISGVGISLNAGAGMNLEWGTGAGAVRYSSANGRTIVTPATAQGNVELGLSGAALATNATHGFASIPSCAGTPTGAPTSTTGAVPLVVDTTNNKLYGYYGGAWHSLSP